MITQENIPYTADEIKAMVKTCEKYNKALERASKICNSDFEPNDKSILCSIIFPELKENEDEYIRKRIIHALRGDVLDMEETIKAITWLEKQKAIDEEIIFRPIVGTDIRIAAKQALEKIDIGKKVVLAFNGAYIPVNGKTVGEIDSEYDAWLEKQGDKTLNAELLTKVLRKHLYTCVNKTNTYVRSEEDHITLTELTDKIKADLNIE